MQSTYLPSKTFGKAAVMVVIAYLVAEINTMIETGTFPSTLDDLRVRGPAIGVALGLGAIKALSNLWKNRHMPGNPLRRPPAYPDLYRAWPFLIVGAAALGMAGCVALPGVSGKTAYSVEFSDATAEQDTRYKMEIRAPAGTELDGITGMTYQWGPDGSGGIAVSQSGSMDSQGQAAMITEVSRQHVEAFRAGLEAGLKAAPLIASTVGARARSPDHVPDTTNMIPAIPPNIIQEALESIRASQTPENTDR